MSWSIGDTIGDPGVEVFAEGYGTEGHCMAVCWLRGVIVASEGETGKPMSLMARWDWTDGALNGRVRLRTLRTLLTSNLLVLFSVLVQGSSGTRISTGDAAGCHDVRNAG